MVTPELVEALDRYADALLKYTQSSMVAPFVTQVGAALQCVARLQDALNMRCIDAIPALIFQTQESLLSVGIEADIVQGHVNVLEASRSVTTERLAAACRAMSLEMQNRLRAETERAFFVSSSSNCIILSVLNASPSAPTLCELWRFEQVLGACDARAATMAEQLMEQVFLPMLSARHGWSANVSAHAGEARLTLSDNPASLTGTAISEVIGVLAYLQHELFLPSVGSTSRIAAALAPLLQVLVSRSLVPTLVSEVKIHIVRRLPAVTTPDELHATVASTRALVLELSEALVSLGYTAGSAHTSDGVPDGWAMTEPLSDLDAWVSTLDAQCARHMQGSILCQVRGILLQMDSSAWNTDVVEMPGAEAPVAGTDAVQPDLPKVQPASRSPPSTDQTINATPSVPAAAAASQPIGTHAPTAPTQPSVKPKGKKTLGGVKISKPVALGASVKAPPNQTKTPHASKQTAGPPHKPSTAPAAADDWGWDDAWDDEPKDADAWDQAWDDDTQTEFWGDVHADTNAESKADRTEEAPEHDAWNDWSEDPWSAETQSPEPKAEPEADPWDTDAWGDEPSLKEESQRDAAGSQHVHKPKFAPAPSDDAPADLDDWGWGDDEEEVNDIPNKTVTEQESSVAQSAPLCDDNDAWGGLGGASSVVQESSAPPTAVQQAYPLVVSMRCVELVGALDRQWATLQAVEAASASLPLAQAFVQSLQLYRALMPTVHAQALQHVPLLTMLFANDCAYLAHAAQTYAVRAAEMPSVYLSQKQTLESALCTEAGLVRDAGQQWQVVQLALQADALNESLDGADGFVRTDDDARHEACVRAVEQVCHILAHLANVWSEVLSRAARSAALSQLIDGVFDRVQREIEDIEDISEPESVRLAALCRALIDGANDVLGDGTSQVPHFFKFAYLPDILTGSLVDIEYLLFENDSGSALVDYSRDEMVALVRALFADTPNRRRVLDRLHRVVQ